MTPTAPAMPRPRKKKQRPHTPAALGPRVYFRGRYAWCDLRPWGGQRVPMRNPNAVGWPAQGEGTEDPEVAARWAFRYLDAVTDDTSRRQLGKRAASKPLGAEVLRHLAYMERVVSPKTLANRNTGLTIHLVPFVGESVAVTSIDHDLMDSWLVGLLAKGYSPGTIGQYIFAASAFFRWASRGAHDPTSELELPEEGERDVEPLTRDEMAALRKAADALDREAPAVVAGRLRRSYRLLAELALCSGARLGELAALRWSAFDSVNKTVRITAQAPLKGTASALRPLKGKKSRTALVLPELWSFYEGYVGDRDPRSLGCVLSSDPASPYVSIGSVDGWAQTLLERAKLNRLGRGVHCLRHTYGREFLERGGRLEQLQQSLGHASIRTTEKSYQWLSGDTAAAMARSAIYGNEGGPKLVTPARRATR